MTSARRDDDPLAAQLRHYQLTVEAADCQLTGRPPIPVETGFSDREGALAWMDANVGILLAAVGQAAGAGHDYAAFSLPLLMANYLAVRGRHQDLLDATAAGRNAARRLGKADAEAEAAHNIGGALCGLRRWDEACAAYQEAAAIHRQAGRTAAAAESFAGTGIALFGLGRHEEAVAVFAAALPALAEKPDVAASVSNNMALALGNLGRAAEAREAFGAATAFYRDAGNELALSRTLASAARLDSTAGQPG